MVDGPTLPAKKVSPDGLSIAIRTQFDDTPGAPVQSWLVATSDGKSLWYTADQVTEWTDT